MTDNENITTTENSSETMTANTYLEELKKLRENTVAKDEYDKLMKDNQALAKAVTEFTPTKQTEAPKEKPDIQKMRSELFDKDAEMTNLEYCKRALELRQSLIDAGEKDPFLPFGHSIAVEENDIKSAQQVVDFLTAAIETADGNPAIFNNELERGLVDSAPNRNNKGGRHNII